MFGIDSLIRYMWPQCRHFIFPSLTLVCCQHNTFRTVPRAAQSAITAAAGHHSQAINSQVFHAVDWYSQAAVSRHSRRLYLNSCLYKRGPLHSRQHIYYKLRIIIHLQRRQLNILKLQRKRIRRSLACLSRTIQKVMRQQLHLPLCRMRDSTSNAKSMHR